MSISTLVAKISQLQKDLADLQKKLSQETKAENEKSRRILQIQSSITKTTSPGMLQTKLKEIQQRSDDIARIQARKADISKQIADKNGTLLKAQMEVGKEQAREQQRARQAQKQLDEQSLRHQRLITQELALQKRIAAETRKTTAAHQSGAEFDAFISHASEDKDDFVRPLATKLSEMGLRIWYDESTLKVGDSLRRMIDNGLARSRYGIVVLSSAFFVKNWPQYELDGMVAREMEGVKVILPIWHKVSKSEVLRFSPSIADKIAINSSISSIEEIAAQINEVIGSGA